MSDEDILIIGRRFFDFVSGGAGGGSGGSEGGLDPFPTLYPGGGGGLPFSIDCNNVRQATTQAPDGAIYFIPRNADKEYLAAALKHISDFTNSRTELDPFPAVRD